MKVLAIDTSQPVGSVALSGDGEATERSFGTRSSHLVELSNAVDELLHERGLRIADIDRLALVAGPGSFTGLRIGLAYVKGVYAARPVDIVALGSLELLALQSLATLVCPMIDARKDEVYAAVYQRPLEALGRTPHPRDLRAQLEPRAVAPQEFLTSLEICPTLFIGTGAARFANLIRDRFGEAAAIAAESQPSTKMLGRMAPTLVPLNGSEVLTAEPFYIRASDAKLRPLKEIRAHD